VVSASNTSAISSQFLQHNDSKVYSCSFSNEIVFKICFPITGVSKSDMKISSIIFAAEYVISISDTEEQYPFCTAIALILIVVCYVCSGGDSIIGDVYSVLSVVGSLLSNV